MILDRFVLAIKFELSDKRGQILVGNFVYMKLWQILKFHERVISALILVASFARPKISSQLLRVNGILKFALRYKFIKRESRGLELRSACSCELAKQRSSPLTIP